MENIYAVCKKDTNPLTEEKEKGLIIGNIYKVENISMGQSYTFIRLEGLQGLFNSVMFDFLEKIDIYKDERFNPYL